MRFFAIATKIHECEKLLHYNESGGLRDSFNREIGKQKKSGSGTSDKKEYMHFNKLSFLKRLNILRPKTNEQTTENNSELEQQQEQDEE
ncbi:hypothetical protein EVAR_41061_1 [Eumeta japonica]|uniref:Uncharacterized protein n=1 Tax=Eumeta variegata TaxID=151549 RepID=A0A4C1XQQ5_EUMVA|nr:hypothetical protein EVAR_41061_1 [Eumeta japonica]